MEVFNDQKVTFKLGDLVLYCMIWATNYKLISS